MARSLGRDLPLHDKMAAQAGLPDQGGKFPAQPNQQKFSVMSQRAGNLGQDGCDRDPLPGAAISLTLAAAKIPRPGARFRCGRSTGSAGTAFFSFLGWQNEKNLSGDSLPGAAISLTSRLRKSHGRVLGSDAGEQQDPPAPPF